MAAAAEFNPVQHLNTLCAGESQKISEAQNLSRVALEVFRATAILHNKPNKGEYSLGKAAVTTYFKMKEELSQAQSDLRMIFSTTKKTQWKEKVEGLKSGGGHSDYYSQLCDRIYQAELRPSAIKNEMTAPCKSSLSNVEFVLREYLTEMLKQGKPFDPWQPNRLALGPSIAKMVRKAHKASEEVSRVSPENFVSVADPDEPSLQNGLPHAFERPLLIERAVEVSQNGKPKMQDTNNHADYGDFNVAGVFDGHTGEWAATELGRFLCRSIATTISTYSKTTQTPLNIYNILQDCFNSFQKTLMQQRVSGTWKGCSGSTAVVCVIDRARHLIYTATLGDSEAVILRKVNGVMVAIPLSVVRNWTSYSDAIRAIKVRDSTQNIKNLDSIRAAFEPVDAILDRKNAKLHRIGGLNVSRSFGEPLLYPITTVEPKITVRELKDGDIVLSATDGVWDYVSLEKLLQLTSTEFLEKGLGVFCTALTAASISSGSQDNITVVAQRITLAPNSAQ